MLPITRARSSPALRICLALGLALAAPGAPARAAVGEDPAAAERTGQAPEIDAGFHLLYELKFPEARAQFAVWQHAHPEDPLGDAAEAASYLFEEFYHQGVLSSEFFLDDKRLLGGIAGKADERHRVGFLAANQRAREKAQRGLKSDAKDVGALFALTISTGMQADFTCLIEKRQFESLHLIREAEGYAKRLLALEPDSQDAYLALGAANYIVGCLPSYKRAFLWFGGIHGDKPGGMEQLRLAALHGHYLRPFAKLMLALAALREKQPGVARTELTDLAAEFPQNPLYARELAKLPPRAAGLGSSP